MTELMWMALGLAESAYAAGNSPFSCILTDTDGTILVTAENTTNIDVNPVAHAEMNAIVQLAKKLNSRKLSDTVLISTVQSCPMCYSAAYRSGIRFFVYGCAEDSTLVPKIDVHILNEYCEPKAEIITGVLENECAKMLEMARKSH